MKFVILAIQILINCVLATEIDCVSGITSAVAVGSQAFKTDGVIRISLNLLSTQTSLQLTFPSVWTNSNINPVQTGTACTVTTDATACTKSGSVYTCTIGPTLTKTIECTSVAGPNTNSPVGALQIRIGTTTCIGILISNFQAYGNALQFTAPQPLGPRTGRTADNLELQWRGITMPFQLTANTFIDFTLITNSQFTSSTSRVLASSTFGGVPQSIEVTVLSKPTANVLNTQNTDTSEQDSVLVFQTRWAQVNGNTQPMTGRIDFRTATNLLYSITFPSIPVTPGSLVVNSITIENREINTFSKYTFSVTTTNQLDSTGVLRIPVLQGSLPSTPTGTCNGIATPTPVFSLTTTPQYIEIGGCLTTAGTHTIIIDQLKNPSSTGATVPFPYFRTFQGGFIVDENSGFTYNAQAFTNGQLIAAYNRDPSSSNMVGGLSFLVVTITPENEIPINGRIVIDIPSEIQFITTGSYTCAPNCAVISSTSSQVNLRTTAMIPAGAPHTITSLTVPVRNPLDLRLTGFFAFTTYEANGINMIDTVSGVSGFQVSTTSSFDGVVQVQMSEAKNGALPAYTFTMKMSTEQLLPMTLTIQVGDLSVVTATPTCTVTGATLGSCFRSGLSAIDFTLTGSGSIAAGTILTVQVAANAIRNKSSFEPSTAFVFTTRSSAAPMSSQSGPTVSNSVAGDITQPTLSVDKPFYAATGATYTFSFRVQNVLGASGYYMNLLCPFSIPTSGISCKDASNNMLICNIGSAANILRINGPFSSGADFQIIISGFPTPASQNAARTFTIETFKVVGSSDYTVDRSSNGAFVFAIQCPVTNNCKQCVNQAFRTCEDPSSSNPKCLTCYDAVTNPNIYMRNQVCVQACGDGYYQNDEVIASSKLTCLSCPANCRTCLPNSTLVLTCSICNTGFVLQENSCVNQCGPTYYLRQPNDISCSKCHSACMTCSVTPTNCQTCIASVPWINNSCLSGGCENGYFQTTSPSKQLICSRCPDTCLICSSATLCTTCIQGYYMLSSSCVAECPPAYFPGEELKCFSCPSNCVQCKNATQCEKCAENYLFHQQTCLSKCPDTFYESKGYCVSCGAGNCRSCQLVDNLPYCLTCSSSYYLLKRETCVTQCPAGYYVASPSECGECSKNCQTCSETETNCLTCGGDFSFLRGSVCVNDCGIGYYPDLSKGACIKCPQECQSCTSDVLCTACNISTQTYYLIEGACRTSCPPKYEPEGLGCRLIPVLPVIDTGPTRYVPVPFLIADAFIGISVIVAKAYRAETFLPGSFVGMSALPVWGAWISLGLLYFFYYDYNVYYFWLLLGGVGGNYLLNILQLCFVKFKIYTDPDFQRWKAASLKNAVSSSFLTFLSLVVNYQAFRMIMSRYLGFSFFKARLIDIKELFYFNLINGLSVIVTQVPILVASALIAYYEPTFESQTFISAIDAVIVTFINLFFLLWETQKEENFFDETIQNRYSMHAIDKHHESGIFNNTLQQKDILLDETKQLDNRYDDQPQSVQNKSQNLSRPASAFYSAGVSIVASDRHSIFIKESIEQFPKSERPHITPVSKHTIYYKNNGNEKDPDPDQEPGLNSAIFSSVKSQRSQHGDNPFEHEPSPLEDLSEIKDSQFEEHENSQLTIFQQPDLTNLPFPRKQFKPVVDGDEENWMENDMNAFNKDKLELRIGKTRGDDMVPEQPQLSEQSSQRSERSGKTTQKPQSRNQLKSQGKSQFESTQFNEGTMMRQSILRQENHSHRSNSKENTFQKQNTQQSIPHSDMMQVSNILQQGIQQRQEEEQQNGECNPSHLRDTAYFQPQSNKKRGTKSQEYQRQEMNTIELQESQDASSFYNQEVKQIDQIPSIHSTSKRVRTADVLNQQVPQFEVEEVEQFQLNVENIDEPPNFTQKHKKGFQKVIPIIKDDTDVQDDDPFSQQENPVFFSRQSQQAFKPKPYKMKLSQKTKTSQVEKVFDTNDSIHTLTDQDWGENQISPSQFNSLNQRYEEDYIVENRLRQQDRQAQQHSLEVIQTDEAGNQVDQSNTSQDSDGLGNQQQLNTEFNKNYHQQKKKHSQLERTYLQRFEVSRKPQNQREPQKRLKPKDITDAYLEPDIGVSDLQF